MVKAVKEAEKAIGKVDYTPTKKQLEGRNFSRSLYVVKDIQKGETITEENVRSIRPGFGLHPKYLSKIIGKRINKTVSKGDRLSLKDIEGQKS